MYPDRQKKLSALFAHQNKNILVAAHRGDWRNAPENSVQGLRNGIAMGAKHGSIPPALTLQLIINPDNPNAQKIVASYQSRPRTIVQVIFKSDTSWIIKELPEIKKHFAVWFNALWPEQNGGHDDDKAVEEGKPGETWGWLIAHGAGIIQTDRPRELLHYIHCKK